jgi:5-methylcytosine-specific restriction protein B
MKPHAESDQGLAEIWKYELLPLLEEQYFGRLNREKVREKFGLAAMRRKAALDIGPVELALAQGYDSAGVGDVTFGAPSESDETEA